MYFLVNVHWQGSAVADSGEVCLVHTNPLRLFKIRANWIANSLELLLELCANVLRTLRPHWNYAEATVSV